jgi:hypothetical protein
MFCQNYKPVIEKFKIIYILNSSLRPFSDTWKPLTNFYIADIRVNLLTHQVFLWFIQHTSKPWNKVHEIGLNDTITLHCRSLKAMP